MRTLLFAVLAACALAASPPPLEFPDMLSGRYELKLSGLLCSVCARAVAAELAKLDEVDSAKVDLDRDAVLVTVKLERKLKIRSVRRALSRAARRANLGAAYEIAGIKYLP